MWYVSSHLSYITINNIELSFKSPNPRMLDFAYVSRLKNKNKIRGELWFVSVNVDTMPSCKNIWAKEKGKTFFLTFTQRSDVAKSDLVIDLKHYGGCIGKKLA